MLIPTAPRPWALSRKAISGQMPAALWPTSMSVDPATQLGKYYGSDGNLLPLMASTKIGKHATRDTSQTPYTTNRDGKQETDGHRSDAHRD